MTLLPKQVTIIPWSGIHKSPRASNQLLASAPMGQLLIFQISSFIKEQVLSCGPCDN